MLRGVLTKVMVQDVLSSMSFASARKGLRWPWDMKGNTTMWGFSAIVEVTIMVMARAEPRGSNGCGGSQDILVSNGCIF